MQNYHRHSCYSNIMIADSSVLNEDYAKRAASLGHKVLSSVEHGWQGYYYETFELAKKYGLKFIFGAEAYWVKDRHEQDRTNSHIVLLAKNENGRRAINRILSDANEDGYYYRPRVDLPLLLSLPANDVFVTTACVAFWQYDDIENIVQTLYNHFGDNFMLEIQYHHTEKQIELNKWIQTLNSRWEIEMIVGLDSHYITPDQSEDRDYVLAAKGLHYEDEDGWFMDYPDDETVFRRFKEQGIFFDDEIRRAMDNTNLLLDFEDYTGPIFTDDIKLPSLYPDKTQEERNKIYSRLITKKYKEYMKVVPEEEHQRYFDGVKSEVDVYKNTGMVDYPLIDYEIVNRAIEKGGIITDSGRGSAVGYFTNTLCGFSKVDRFQSPIKLYPERFISESRILETKSLPDLDLNCGNPEVFEQAQVEVMGKDHAYPMIAFGTFKKKSAFKLYARAQKLDFEIANTISAQIEKYDTAMKYADDDERDELDIYDFVDEKYHDYITQSQAYWGIIADKKKAPCSYVLYAGNIREEIGLIKCKSETTNKEYITTVIDGAVAEKYKFLKNDLLKVDVVYLIEAIYRRIGIHHHSVSELMELIKDDKAVWDIYANGYTIGINQCEKESTTRKVMKYAPKNVSELSAFIAAIRPGFKSMYSRFESREPFSYGIKAFDDLLQTKEFPYSFLLYQEQAMQTLNFAGFPIDECYGIIKSIAKKHPEKVRPLKARFLEGFKARLLEAEDVQEDEALQLSDKVWQIIDDSCNYSFNSAHAYCMALDSLYCAYLKAHHPYEFYEVLMQVYSDKGKKDKVAILKQEMQQAFNIQEGKFEFGADNRNFVADPARGVINPSLLSLKSLSQKCANDLYKLGQTYKGNNFYELLKLLKTTKSIDSGKLNVLVKIGYFDGFGSIRRIETFLGYFEELYGRSQFGKDADLPANLLKVVKMFSASETEKQYRAFDFDAALQYIWEHTKDEATPLSVRLQNEMEYLGYIKSLQPDFTPDIAFVQAIETKFKNPKVTLCRLCNGEIESIKIKANDFNKAPMSVGDIIRTVEATEEGRWSKDANGKWQQDNSNKEPILKQWTFMR